MSILVTGACGYIGSHVCVELVAAGYEVVALDNLFNSYYDTLQGIERITGKVIPFYMYDLTNFDETLSVFASQNIDVVVHLAGAKSVSESVADPLQYYNSMVLATINLLRAMQVGNTSKLVFSSSASVYGCGATCPINESNTRSATSPYGECKILIEDMLATMHRAYNLDVVVLRYFNPIGQHISRLIDERPKYNNDNLLPSIRRILNMCDQRLKVFGDDYNTHDGTCVRDYVHVVDIARGHVSAVDSINRSKGYNVYNLGLGKGQSVLDIIASVQRVNNITVPYDIVGRRSGDVAECYADTAKARIELGWSAIYDMDDMCIL